MFGTVVILVIAAYFIWDYLHHKQLLPFKNKIVFITGCDSGFGRALVEHLDSVGCHVIAGCFTVKGKSELSNATFKNVNSVHIDVGDTASIEEAYTQVKTILNGKELWGVVNNAGIVGAAGPIEFVFRKNLQATFNINMAGMAEVARVFLPLLKHSRGRLVNMVSILGRFGARDLSVYVASKYAMEGYSDCQRRELAEWGISVSILNPGVFATNLVNKEVFTASMQAQYDAVDEQIKHAYGTDYVQQAVKNAVKLTTGGSPHLYKVTDAFTHALFAVNPRLRYIVGNDAKVMWFLSLLPGQVPDLLMKYVPRAFKPKIPANYAST